MTTRAIDADRWNRSLGTKIERGGLGIPRGYDEVAETYAAKRSEEGHELDTLEELLEPLPDSRNRRKRG